MEDALSVALYARVSSQQQANDMTIQSQVESLKNRISSDGLRIDDERCFLDEGYSGGSLQRPALERLRDVAYCGGIDRLYVHSPDRLSRKYAYQVLLLEEFRKYDVEVVFLNHDSQDQSAEGEMLLQMQGMIAEYERAKILERTRRGRRFAARQGKVSAIAHAPYGYRYLSKQEADGEARYELVLDEARVVKEIFTWVGVEGLSLGDVVRRLAEKGVPTATGNGHWDRATIRGLLTHPAYTGNAKYPRTRLVPRKPSHRPKRGDPATPRQEKVARATSPEEQETILVPAIVSQELFDAVTEKLEHNRRRYREQKKGAVFLLSGLLVCHQCGSAYCGRRQRRAKNNFPYVYYRCIGTDKYRHRGESICTNKSITGEGIETAVWSDVCSLLRDPDRLRREFERRLERPTNEQGDTTHMEQSIAQLKRRIARLIDAYENGWVDKPEFEPRIQRVKERLCREEEALSQCQRDSSNEQELRLIVGQFEMFCQHIAKGLDQLDMDTKRKILRLLIERVEVDEAEIRIVYKVQPRPFVPGPVSRGDLQHCLKFDTVAQGKQYASFTSECAALGPDAQHNTKP